MNTVQHKVHNNVYFGINKSVHWSMWSCTETVFTEVCLLLIHEHINRQEVGKNLNLKPLEMHALSRTMKSE